MSDYQDLADKLDQCSDLMLELAQHLHRVERQVRTLAEDVHSRRNIDEDALTRTKRVLTQAVQAFRGQ